MKTIFRCLLLLMMASASLPAQDTPPVGFVRIVNAVSPGTGNASILIDGKNLYPEGYQLGQTTGGYGVKSGSRTIEVRKTGIETGTTKLNLQTGETISIIAFAERLPAEKVEDPPKWAIKLLRLKQQDVERGFGLSVISVSNDEETAVDLAILGKEKVEKAYAKRLKITKVDLGGMRGEIIVKVGDKIVTTVSPDSPGNYVVILFGNKQDGYEAINFFDPKFVIAG